MSTDALTISLTGPLAEEVRAAAQAQGLTPEEYVREQLADDLAFEGEYNDLSWEEDLRRLEEPGENVSAEELFTEIRTRLEARLAPRK
ncbi:MAG: hypothetical protein ACREH4_09635 [Vitreimonas sp.]